MQHAEWNGCTHAQMRMMDAIMALDQLVDESDPDVDFPNSFHAFQTAEGIRQAHPDKGKHGERLNCALGCTHFITKQYVFPAQTGSSWWASFTTLGK